MPRRGGLYGGGGSIVIDTGRFLACMPATVVVVGCSGESWSRVAKSKTIVCGEVLLWGWLWAQLLAYGETHLREEPKYNGGVSQTGHDYYSLFLQNEDGRLSGSIAEARS